MKKRRADGTSEADEEQPPRKKHKPESVSVSNDAESKSKRRVGVFQCRDMVLSIASFLEHGERIGFARTLRKTEYTLLTSDPVSSKYWEAVLFRILEHFHWIVDEFCGWASAEARSSFAIHLAPFKGAKLTVPDGSMTRSHLLLLQQKAQTMPPFTACRRLFNRDPELIRESQPDIREFERYNFASIRWNVSCLEPLLLDPTYDRYRSLQWYTSKPSMEFVINWLWPIQDKGKCTKCGADGRSIRRTSRPPEILKEWLCATCLQTITA